MNTDTITQKLHEKADAELRERLHKAFFALRHEFTDGSYKNITVSGGYIQGENNQSKSCLVDAHAALKALENLYFDVQRDANRAKAINDFMTSVERLGQEVDEIRSAIQ